jgi:hypothetical protein
MCEHTAHHTRCTLNQLRMCMDTNYISKNNIRGAKCKWSRHANVDNRMHVIFFFNMLARHRRSRFATGIPDLPCRHHARHGTGLLPTDPFSRLIIARIYALRPFPETIHSSLSLTTNSVGARSQCTRAATTCLVGGPRTNLQCRRCATKSSLFRDPDTTSTTEVAAALVVHQLSQAIVVVCL